MTKNLKKVADPKLNNYPELAPNKSARIRAMHADGVSTGDIARSLGIIYQFANNVINRPLKTAAK